MLKAIERETARSPWGLARKVVNIFLRDCLNNHYLRKHYRLQRMERWLELPLDSVVTNYMRKEAKEEGRESLPRWRGLTHLEKEDYRQYQEYAKKRAKRMSYPAVIHMDLELWLDNK